MHVVTKRIIQAIVVAVFVFLVIIVGCGDHSHDGIDEPTQPEPTFLRKIGNQIRQNETPFGVSSFPLGVVNKFPIEDNQQIDSIGFKHVVTTIQKIATNELYTFPEKPDEQQVYDFIEFLVNEGHEVTHEIHILNGPGMRTCTDWFVNGVMGRKICDEEFVSLIQWNGQMRDAVLNLFAKVVSHAKRLEAIGADVLICPELEDNHPAGKWNSYGVLLDFLRAAGWQDQNGELRRDKVVRNGGHPGKIEGIRYEAHGHSLEQLYYSGLGRGDIMNMDGKSFYYEGEEPKDFLFSEDEVRKMLEWCNDRGIIFYIWPAKLQGLRRAGRFDYGPWPEYQNRAYILDKPVRLISILQNIAEEDVIVLDPTSPDYVYPNVWPTEAVVKLVE